MTTRTTIEGFLAIALLVLGTLGVRTWLDEHDQRVKLSATLETQAKAQAQAQQQVESLQKQMADRDAQNQAQLQTLNRQFAQAMSPEALAQLISQRMALPQPIQVQRPAGTDGNPHPAPEAQIPQIDFPQAKSYIEACESCKLQVSKLQADAADRAKEAALAQQQIESLKTERDAAVKVAKGGSVLQRIGRAAKWLAIGAGVGYAAARAHR